MSAWIVNRDHLDLLLTAAIAWNLTDADTAGDTGRMLWAENLASVAYLYAADRDGDRPGPIDFRDRDVTRYIAQPYPGRVDPEVVYTAAQSLHFQSCEHPGWVASTGRTWIERLMQEAAARVPAYLAAYGPVDPTRQAAGDHGWYVLVDLDGNRQIRCGDGWSVPDRGVFDRAATVRTVAVTSVS